MAGDPADTVPFLSHGARVALLDNARRIARSVAHPALASLVDVIQSAWGPMLVYEWIAGELVHAPVKRRADPTSAYQRFRRLPPEKLAAAISTTLDAHVALCRAGWIACDFYDGSIIYDFATHRTRMIDLDSYHLGNFINGMGRMFGSTRFMAPEEFERGALVDERTTVFNLGRAVSEFLGDGALGKERFRGTEDQHRVMTRACEPDPAARFQSVADMARFWRDYPLA